MNLLTDRIFPHGQLGLLSACLAASTVSVFLAGVIELALLGHFVPRNVFTWYEIAGAMLLSPGLETLLFQGLPWVIFNERLSSFKCMLLMSIPFGIAHAANGVAVVISSCVVGVVLSSVFVVAVRRSGKAALWSTILTHTLHNGLTLLLSSISRSIG